MLNYGRNVTGYNILLYLSNNVDSIILGKVYSAVTLGLYSRAKLLSQLPVSLLFEPIQYVSLPALSALQSEESKYQNYFEKMLSVLCFLYMPVIVYITMYAREIVYVALGTQWMDAVPVFRLLAISIFVSPLVMAFGLIMLSSGKTTKYLIWGLFNSGITVIGFGIGIKWGLLGLASSWSVTAITNLIFSFFYVFRESAVSAIGTLRTMCKPAIASVGLGIVLWGSYDILGNFGVGIRLALSLFVGGFAYIIFWRLLPGKSVDMGELISYMLRLVRRR